MGDLWDTGYLAAETPRLGRKPHANRRSLVGIFPFGKRQFVWKVEDFLSIFSLFYGSLWFDVTNYLKESGIFPVTKLLMCPFLENKTLIFLSFFILFLFFSLGLIEIYHKLGNPLALSDFNLTMAQRHIFVC